MDCKEKENNKRIARNTLFLYLRMILIMGVSLFTSRVILRALGDVDFGLYNVVGGIITIFLFVSDSMAGTSSRYITVALGGGNEVELQRVVSTTRLIQIFFAAIIFILAETIGLWLLFNKLVIPADRMTAAFWVYQCSVVTSMVTILSAPYNALIIAHEQMKAFAYISVFEAMARLAIAYIIEWCSTDRLIVYAVLLLVLQLGVRFCYSLYCRRHFPESVAPLVYEKGRIKEMFAYSGWTSLGHLAIAGYTQGLNILLNIFFGPMVNAARAISVQVQGAVTRFVTNFQMALNPQITKSYAAGDLDYMHKLVLYSSKYAFFLMSLLSFPVILNAEYILHLWLGEVPEYTVAFVRLTLVISTVETLKNSVLTSLHATGRIRKVQIIESCTLLMIVPVSYVILKSGVARPESVFVVYLCVEMLTQMLRVRFILPLIQLNVYRYIKVVIVPLLFMALFLGALFVVYKPHHDFSSFLLSSLVSVCVILLLVYFIGFSRLERTMLGEKVRQFYLQRKAKR